MAAPQGNQFWKLRLKHGRDCKIDSPIELKENFEQYADWLENNPLNELDYRGKDITPVLLPKKRLFQKNGFALACGLSGWDVIESWKKRSEDFLEVITRIEKYIENQQLEGAAAGFFKENIVSRLLGLSDKTENKHTIENPKFPEWFKEGDNEGE